MTARHCVIPAKLVLDLIGELESRGARHGPAPFARDSKETVTIEGGDCCNDCCGLLQVLVPPSLFGCFDFGGTVICVPSNIMTPMTLLGIDSDMVYSLCSALI